MVINSGQMKRNRWHSLGREIESCLGIRECFSLSTIWSGYCHYAGVMMGGWGNLADVRCHGLSSPPVWALPLRTFCCQNQWTYVILWIFVLLWLLILSMDTVMATTETAAIITKGTTEQNKTWWLFICSSRESIFCCVLYNNLAVSCWCLCCSHNGVHWQNQQSQ